MHVKLTNNIIYNLLLVWIELFDSHSILFHLCGLTVRLFEYAPALSHFPSCYYYSHFSLSLKSNYSHIYRLTTTLYDNFMSMKIFYLWIGSVKNEKLMIFDIFKTWFSHKIPLLCCWRLNNNQHNNTDYIRYLRIPVAYWPYLQRHNTTFNTTFACCEATQYQLTPYLHTYPLSIKSIYYKECRKRRHTHKHTYIFYKY